VKVTDTESFILKSQAVHKDFYDYTLCDYKNTKKDVIIICRDHGTFYQKPTNHLQGKGCDTCGRLKSINSKRKFNNEMIEQIKGEWLGEDMSCESLAKKYNVTDAAIHYHVKKIKKYRVRDFKNKSTRSNEYVFHDINEVSAYWIGMLMADGCISSTEKNKEPRVVLVLHRKDEEEIKKFKKWTEFTGKITYGEKKDKETGAVTPFARISISSLIMCTELSKYGVIERKTMEAKVKKLHNNADFWRGAICGDGYVGIIGSTPTLEFSGSYQICNQFKKFCKKFIKSKANVTPDKSIFRYRLKGSSAYKIVHVLFGNATYGLNRKMTMAKKILETC